MAIVFPGDLDSLTNPTSSDNLTSPDHAVQHSDTNDAIEAIEAKIGVDGSEVVGTVDYKLSHNVQAGINSTGLTSGGLLSINGSDDTLFDLSAGTGVIVDVYTNPANPVITNVSWTAKTAQVTPYLNTFPTTYIAIDASQTLHFKTEDFNSEERRNWIVIGWVDHPDFTTITWTLTEPIYNTEVLSQFQDLVISLAPFVIDGIKYLPSSGLTIKRTEGHVFDNNANYQTEKRSPNIIIEPEENPCNILYFYRDGGTSWINDLPAVGEVDPNHYDDGSGTLALVPVGRWTIQVISFYPILGWSGNDIQYGQNTYPSYRDAKIGLEEVAELNPYNNPSDLYRTYMIVKQGATDLTTKEQADFYNAGKMGLFHEGDSLVDQDTIMSEEEFTLARLQNFCGLISGGLISIATGNTTLDITAGTSSYADYTDPANPVIEILSWNSQNVNPGLSASVPRVWIGVQRLSAGVGKIVFSSAFTGLEKRKIVVIGRAWGNGTSTITGRGQYTTTAYYQTNALIDLIRALGSLNRDGNTFVPNGTNLLLDKSSGNSFRFTANYLAEPTSPNSIVNPTMTGITNYQYHIYNDTIIHIHTEVDPEYYDLNGVKTAVPTGKFTVQRVYYFPVSNVVDITYGQAVYQTLAEATAAATLEQVKIDSLNLSTLDGSILRAYLIVKQGTTALNDPTKATLISVSNLGAGGGSSGVVGIVDHNDLQNIQGGTTAEYYHLTSTQYTIVGNTSGTNSGDSATPPETVTTIGALISGATAKTTPVDADMVGLMDSGATNILKKLSWTNIKSTLKTYFDTVYTLANLGGVPTSRTVNSKALSSNVTLTTADVADSSDKRYCTDAQKTVIGNTSGANSGDNSSNSSSAPIAHVGAGGTAHADVIAAGASGFMTGSDKTKLNAITGTNTGNETATTIGVIMNGLTAKTSPVDADTVALIDSEASNVLKKLSWTSIKSTLKTYFDTIYTIVNLGGVPTSRTVNSKALSSDITLSLASADFANQGTNTTFLLGNASGNPSWATPLGYTLAVQALTSSPTDAQTIYLGNIPAAPATVAATRKIYIRKTGTIKIAEIYSYSGTAGSNESWSIYVRLNNTTDTLIQAVSAATSERVFSNLSLNIAVVAGDYIEIKSVNPTWGTNPLTTIFGGYIYIE